MRVTGTCTEKIACLVEDLAGDIMIPGPEHIQNTASGHIESSILVFGLCGVSELLLPSPYFLLDLS